MLKRPLGQTNLMVSVLGFGAATIAYLGSDHDRAAGVIDLLLKAGVNLIDTAAGYPGSEEFLGERFSDRRREFILVSKCGYKTADLDGPDWSESLIAATVDRSLRLLKTDHLDVMLLHSCKLDVLKKGEAMAALADAREAGKVRFIGYSGDNEPAAYAADLPEVDVIQTSINITDQNNIDMVLPAARKNNIGIIAKRPIANAAWKDLSEQPGMYQDYAKEYTDRLKAMKITPASVGFKSSSGDERDAWPEMALRFTLSFDKVATAIIGTTNPDNAAANVRYASAGGLPEEVMRKLREAFRRADPQRKWTGQT